MTPFLWLCPMGGLAIFSSTMSKNPTLPLFIHSLGVDERALGFIAAASTVVGIVASLPAGVLSDLWGRRRVILLNMAVFARAGRGTAGRLRRHLHHLGFVVATSVALAPLRTTEVVTTTKSPMSSSSHWYNLKPDTEGRNRHEVGNS